MEEERFHSTVMWFTQNNEKFCNSCKGHTVKAQFVAFFKEITFRLRYALGMRQLLRSIPFLFVRHTQCIMGQWRLYVSLAWRISMCTSCLCLRPSSKVWFWIKILLELLELLLVLTTSREQPCCWLCILYLFCYSAIKQVSTYSSNNWKDSLLSTNILTCIFYGIF